MSGTGSEAPKKKVEKKPKTNEEIVSGFNKLRTEQRLLSHKITGFEMEQQEHKSVFAHVYNTFCTKDVLCLSDWLSQR